MNNQLRTIFTDIYQHNRWGSQQSRSGPGSELATVTTVGIKITYLLRELQVKSVLNLPCGDQNWHQHMSDQDYIGADIVPELIEANLVKYPGVDFRVLDITSDDLPNVDLILVRDLFGHLSHENTLKALRNIKRSGSRYLLATSFTGRTSNPRVPDGGWMPISLCIEPFNLIPHYLINENCQEGSKTNPPGSYRDKCLILFEVEEIPNYEI